MPGSLHSFFIGMESNESLCRLYILSKQAVASCRVADFTPLKGNKSLPSMNILLEVIAIQRAMDEESNTPDEADEAEEILARCMFTLSTQTHFALKAKSASTRDARIPRSFQEAFKSQHWADAIDCEYDALVELNNWKLISFQDGMNPLPYTWKFRIKDTTGADVPFIHKARRCMRGDKQVEYHN